MTVAHDAAVDDDLLSVAADVVAHARALGADQADAQITSGIESTVAVRKGQVEKLFEAGSRSLSLRVIRGKRTAVCNTSDFTPQALRDLARSAVDLARISEPDDFAGLPEPADLAAGTDARLQLYDERVESLTIDEMTQTVLRAEQAAFDFDSRITNSEGAEFGAARGRVALANSLGFAGSYPYTAASFSVAVLADEPDGKKQSDYWFSAERALHRLATPEDVGRRAAARVVRKLGARKITTRQVPVVWDAAMTAGLLSAVAGAASGEALFKRSTFLADSEGRAACSPLVSIVDDATLPGRLGSRPFDGEGVGSRVNPIVGRGVFRQFLFDTYYGRRTGRRTTGSAARAGDAITVGSGNRLWLAGDTDPAALIAGVQDGLYLTDLMGFGINQTTGDFSRGAAGVWIERGELVYPVVEINVSGNLREMLLEIDGVGNDLEWFGASAAPTIRMPRLVISGL